VRFDDHDVAVGPCIDFEFWMFDVHKDDSMLILLIESPGRVRRHSEPETLYDGEAIPPVQTF
jgi:hypothetical protein